MRKHNPENERVKREYLLWLRNAQGRSEATLDMVAAHIDRFEAHAGYRSFRGFRREQAIAFKTHLSAAANEVTGKPLSKATVYATLKSLRAFFEWLSREPGYRRTVHASDAAYFRPTDNDARTATASRERPAPSVEQVRRVLAAMPDATVVARRDRAVLALIMLTGARDAAVASLKLKHVSLSHRTLFQDPRDVATKRAKTISTVFFPVGRDFEDVLTAWMDELRNDHLFGPDDPLLPATRLQLDSSGQFAPAGIDRRHWNSAAPIREIFRRAFERVGLPYYNPHSLRRTLVRLAYELNLTPRQLKAWSQNLGHESVLTSIGSYGALSLVEQADVISGLANQVSEPNAEVMKIARQIMALKGSRSAAEP